MLTIKLNAQILQFVAAQEHGATAIEIQDRFAIGVTNAIDVAGAIGNLHKNRLIAETWDNGHLRYAATATGHRLLADPNLNPPLEVRLCPARSVATVCIDEGALNDWWTEQDVEVKANAFLLWTLGSTAAMPAEGDEECEPAIPVAGTLHCDATMDDEVRRATAAAPENDGAAAI